MMIAGDRKSCNANKISISTRPPMCHSRPRLKHSRAGYSGNPYSASLLGELVSLEARYTADRKWIPAFAGMTGWGAGPGWPTAIGPPRATSGIGRPTLFTNTPVEAIPVRLLAWEKNVVWIKRGINMARGWPRATSSINTNAATSSINMARGHPECCHQQRIHPTPFHPEQCEGSAVRNLSRQHRVHPAHSSLTQGRRKSRSFT